MGAAARPACLPCVLCDAAALPLPTPVELDAVVNTLFFLSLSRPLSIFPEGTLHRMQQRWAARGWVGRCAAALACCYWGNGGGGGDGPPPPEAEESGKDVDKGSDPEDWEPSSPGVY